MYAGRTELYHQPGRQSRGAGVCASRVKHTSSVKHKASESEKERFEKQFTRPSRLAYLAYSVQSVFTPWSSLIEAGVEKLRAAPSL